MPKMANIRGALQDRVVAILFRGRLWVSPHRQGARKPPSIKRTLY